MHPAAAAMRLKIAVCAGMIAGFLLSPKLWISSRLYPLTPVWSGLKPVAFPFDYLLFAAIILLTLVIAAVPRPAKWIHAFIGLALFLAAFDQSRWQPWFYEYLFLLVALGFSGTQGVALNTCRLIVASTYFWSGMQKINPNFAEGVFSWLMEPYLAVLPNVAHSAVRPLALATPFLEAAVGAGLLSKRFRTVAVLLAIAIHTLILVAIGPAGHNVNQVVWPWNLAMIAFVMLLFWNTPGVPAKDIVWVRNSRFHVLVLILFGIAPLLSFFNLWDNYLSAALYAGNRNEAVIYMSDAAAGRLPDAIQEYVTVEDSKADELSITDWSWGELNVPPYREPRIYKNITRSICTYLSADDEVRLVITAKAAWRNGGARTEFTCLALAGSPPLRK
jgi:hypothetical protein